MLCPGAGLRVAIEFENLITDNETAFTLLLYRGR